MNIFKANIENLTINNNNYRKVLFTTENSQLVLMNLLPEQEIGYEIHPHTTQFIRVEEGNGVAYITIANSEKRYNLKPGDCIMIPNNTWHNIKATGNLKLYTIYSPPEHEDKLVQKYKPLID